MQNWYYTKNGERQGPVPLAELEAMAHRGKIDPQKDLVWTDGMPDWKIGNQVEGLFKVHTDETGEGVNPYAAPLTGADDLLAKIAKGSVEEVEPGSVDLDIIAVAKRAAALTRRHFLTLIGIGIVYFVIILVLEFGLSQLESALGWSTKGILPGGIGAEIPGAAQQHSILGFFISTAFSVFLGLGFARCALNIASGEAASVGTLFSQGSKVINAILASVLFGLMVVLGLILLIVPGVIVALRLSMFQEAIVDRNLGAIEALKYSYRLTQNNGLNMLGFVFLTFVIIVAGALALLVGLIYAFPVVMLMTPLTYRFLQYGRQALTDHPGTETPILQGQCSKE